MEMTDAPELIGLDSESQAAFRRLAMSLPMALLLVDSARAITAGNTESERQFGYPLAELIGRSIDDLVPGCPSIADVPRGQGDVTGTVRNLAGRRRDGSEFPCELGLSRVTTEHGTSLLALVADMTVRRQGEPQQTFVADESLAFERVVAQFAATFINLPVDRVDDTIRDALRRVGEALSLDRCTFTRLLPDATAMALVGWERPGVPPAPAPVPVKEQFPWVYETLLSGRVLSFSSLDDIPNPIDRAGYASMGVKSAVTVPLSIGGQIVGGVGFNTLRAERSWPPDVVSRLHLFAIAFGSVLARRQHDESLQRMLAEAERLRERLRAENVHLRAESREWFGAGNIVGESEAVRRVLDQLSLVAPTSATVLLLGETGTGKELFAARIHELSGRRARVMVRVNCAAIPPTLLESELFGREKGAFTGALTRQIGRFELADHSTIFLDEIGDLPTDVQVKLLRVLEERQLERLGSPRPVRVDTRIIAATHRNLEARLADGTFREDLFYRLNVFPIQVPPLRERREDIPLLVWHFVATFSKAFAKRIDAIPSENMAALQQYSWPGNIRELRNIVERAMILATTRRLTITLPAAHSPASARSDRLTDIEKEHIRSVLESTGWRIRGAGGAADKLGLKPTTLETRLAKLGLKRAR